MVRAEKETDLSFKVGGIIELIGPAEGTDWDEGTPVRAGAVLAELKQADFVASMWLLQRTVKPIQTRLAV
jgi:hypothetical protein